MLRLFVGAYPDAPWAADAIRLVDSVALPPRARRTPPEAQHLTLQFIGDTPERELPAVIESVERSAAGISALHLTPARLIALPERGSARLIALEFDTPPPLIEIHSRLVSRLARRPRACGNDRFLPHMTLCRFEPSTPPPGLPRTVEFGPLPVTEIRLMRSELHHGGAAHTLLRRVVLAGASPPDRPITH